MRSLSSGELIRIRKIVDESIKSMNLNLKGSVVLTEAATGYFFLTPILAAISGAEVYALAKNSPYGQSDEVISYIKKLAPFFGVEKRIHLIKKLTPEIILEADIVTNSGFLRPIDKKFIKLMKKTAVVPLMYEAWELRAQDVDAKSCQQKGILYQGTNENAPELKVFDFVGPVLMKMIFEAGLEIYQNNFLLISDDQFGKIATKFLKRNGANVFQILPDVKPDPKKIPFSRVDAIIIASYKYLEDLIGEKAAIEPRTIKKYFPETKIIQFVGSVNAGDIAKAGIPLLGGKLPPQKMAKTFGDLGPLPVVKLQAAGLKVGENLWRKRKKY